MDNIAIGERLKESRTRGKFTQKQVCDELDIPNIQTLSSYEHGKGLTVENLSKLAELYKVSADWILFGERNTSAERTSYDYILQFIEAVDYLGMITYDSSGNGDTPDVIDLRSSKYEGIEDFLESWCKYRELWEEKRLTHDEYMTITSARIPHRLNERPKEKDPCEAAMENGELPF